jgi:invasion protein IalB
MIARFALAALPAVLLAHAAFGQTAVPETAVAPDAVESAVEPAASLETFEQWTLRCVEREAAPPCDVVQVLTDRASGAQALLISIARSPTEAIDAIQIVGPLGVHIPSGLGLRAGALAVEGVRFARCELQGCVVEARLGEDMLAAMQASEALELTFVVTPGQAPVVLTVDLAGFSEAYAALLARSPAAESQPE